MVKEKYTGYIKIRIRHLFLIFAGIILIRLLVDTPTWFGSIVFIFNIIMWMIYRCVDKESGIK